MNPNIFELKINLSEELSISNNVIELTNRIYNECINSLKKCNLKSSNEFYRYFKETEFNVSTNNLIPNLDVIHIKLFCYVFRNEDEYKIYNRSLNTNCMADFDNGLIELRLVMINENPNEEFYSSIQHEVSHLFQYANGCRKNENLYSRIVNVYNNVKSSDKERWAAYLLYLTFRTEQDSFVNQYYAYLKQNNVSWDDVYKYFPDDDGNPYSKFLDAYDTFLELNMSNDEIVKAFGINKKQYMIRVYNADKRMRNKMMKAAAKYRKDIENDHGWINDTNRVNFMVENMSYGINYRSSEFDF